MSSQPFNNETDIPLSNITALNDDIVQRWMAGPNTRGTADILYTCIVTIVLCVWTSVHMNIPGPGEHAYRQWVRKIKWTLFGLLGPEIVLFTAWWQYRHAKDLIDYLNEQRTLHEDKKTLKQSVNEPFNLRYGFFAVMGGFRFPNPGFEETSSTILLKPDALRALADTGRFLCINDNEVRDRSKADGLAKVLICAQVTWLSVECVARKASNLPLTILEIHTFIHVVCAITIYLIWFQKPLDIGEATVVDLQVEDDEVLSLIYLLSSLTKEKSYQVQSVCDGDHRSAPQWFEFTTYWTAHLDRKPDDSVDAAAVLTAKPVIGDFQEGFSKRLYVKSYTITGDDDSGLRVLANADAFAESSLKNDVTAYELEWPDTMLPLFRKQAYRAWTRINNTDVDWAAWNIRMGARARNFGGWRDSGFSLVIQTLILMAYGGVHLAAWSSHFPTKTEMWMWRASALLLAGTTPLVFASLIPAVVYAMIWEKGPTLSKRCETWIFSLAIIFGLAVFAAYVFARCFLVIESFISLRSVPIGVYSALPWSSYFPHI